MTDTHADPLEAEILRAAAVLTSWMVRRSGDQDAASRLGREAISVALDRDADTYVVRWDSDATVVARITSDTMAMAVAAQRTIQLRHAAEGPTH